MSQDITQIIQQLINAEAKYDLKVLDHIISIQLAKLNEYDSNTDIELALFNLIELLKIRQDFAPTESVELETIEL